MKARLALGLVIVVTLAGSAFVWVKAQNGFSAHDEPSKIEAVVVRFVRSVSVPASAKALQSPTTIDETKLADARMHWADHCFTCHANDGSGETPIGRNLYPKPPDMRSSITQGKTDGELFFIIKNGIRLTGMPAWGADGQQDEDSWALVALIRSLKTLTPTQLRAMESMNPKSPHELMEERDEDTFLQDSHKSETTP